jgi:hypothetical protein
VSAQPDPDFIEFFSADFKTKSQWQRLLDMVPFDMSWDRKAAWLLWTLGQHYDGETPWQWQEVLASVCRTAPVGMSEPVNHTETEYWPPDPGPVQFSFNSEGR